MARIRIVAGVGLGGGALLLALVAGVLARSAHRSLPVRIIAVSGSAIAVDERGGYAVIAGASGGRVSVLDTHSGVILHTVAVNGRGQGFGFWSLLVLDGRRRRAFIVNKDYYGRPGTVNVVDTSRGTLLRVITATAPAVALAEDERAGRLFVVSGSWYFPWVRGTVTVLNAPDGRILGSSPIGERSGGVAVDEQAGRAFVTTQYTDRSGNPVGPGRVGVLATASGHVLYTASVPQNPEQMAVAPRSGRVFVLSRAGQSPYTGHVSALDARSGRVLGTAPAGDNSSALMVDEPARRLFVMNTGYWPGKGSISVLDARNGTLVRTATLQDEPVTMAIDVRRGHVFVAAVHRDGRGNYVGPGRVYMLGAHDGRILATVTVGNNPSGVVVDERSGRVFVATQGTYGPQSTDFPIPTEVGHVSVLDARSGSLLDTVPVGILPSAPALDERAGHVFVLNWGGTIESAGGTDFWSWVLGWLRRRLPFPRPPGKSVHTELPSVSMIDVEP